MGELGRYMGKLELGHEETDLGKVRQREGRSHLTQDQPWEAMEWRTARTKTHRGLDGHPTRGAFGLARMQRKAGKFLSAES